MTDESRPRWRGVNHLALVTGDMDATTRFYVGALGARLVATVGTPDFRHYFFEVGTGSTIAFFQYANVPVDGFAKPAGVPHPRATQFDHLSLDLAADDGWPVERRGVVRGCLHDADRREPAGQTPGLQRHRRGRGDRSRKSARSRLRPRQRLVVARGQGAAVGEVALSG